MSLILAIVLALAMTIPLLARASSVKSAATAALAAAAPLSAVLAVLLTVITAVFAGPLAIIPAVPAAVLVAVQLPRRRPRGPAGNPGSPAERTLTVRVLSLNVQVGRVSPDVVVGQIESLAPDIFAIQELTPRLAQALATSRLPSLLPHSYLQPGPGGRGIGIWSRWPLGQVTEISDHRRPMPRFTLDAGQPVTVTLVHPQAPVAAQLHLWHESLARLLASLPEVTGHHVLIGDFNASRDMRPFRRLLSAGYADCSDVARHRPWPGTTFPANVKIPPLVRLDHILVSETGIAVHESRHLKVPRSDHLGVFAVMDLPPATANSATQAGPASSATTI